MDSIISSLFKSSINFGLGCSDIRLMSSTSKQIPILSSDPIQLESAQSALLVAVIKATPNQVILSVARDYCLNRIKEIVSTTTSYIPRIPSYGSRFYYFPFATLYSSSAAVTPLKGTDGHVVVGSGHVTDAGSSCDMTTHRSVQCRKDGKGIKLSDVRRRSETIDTRSSGSRISGEREQFLKNQTNKKYEVVMAFMKLLIKLILNFLLEIISFTLRFI